MVLKKDLAFVALIVLAGNAFGQDTSGSHKTRVQNGTGEGDSPQGLSILLTSEEALNESKAFHECRRLLRCFTPHE